MDASLRLKNIKQFDIEMSTPANDFHPTSYNWQLAITGLKTCNYNYFGDEFISSTFVSDIEADISR